MAQGSAPAITWGRARSGSRRAGRAARGRQDPRSWDRCAHGSRRSCATSIEQEEDDMVHVIVPDKPGLASGVRRMPCCPTQVSGRGHCIAGRRAGMGHLHLATHPGASMLDRVTRARVLRLSRLEQVKDVLRARCRPEREELVIRIGESPTAADRHEAQVPDLRRIIAGTCIPGIRSTPKAAPATGRRWGVGLDCGGRSGERAQGRLRAGWRRALLVLVHGAGVDGRMWRPQLAALADEFTVVAWDEPGAAALTMCRPASAWRAMRDVSRRSSTRSISAQRTSRGFPGAPGVRGSPPPS